MGPFPKIFQIGDVYISKIFQGPVEVTEKIDGSQFGFGIIDGELYCRSKGKELIVGAHDKMFNEAVEYVDSVKDLMCDGEFYYAEYMRKPKHNTLAYERIPVNHLALFGVLEKDGSFIADHKWLSIRSEKLGISVVPLIYQGNLNSPEDLFEMIEQESFLGGVNMEGVVIKNYAHIFEIGNRIYPLLAGKYVSEKFKEKHNVEKRNYTGKGKWEIYMEQFLTEARWEKAIQHLRDDGNLEGSARDIGVLIKEIQRDIVEEEKHNIMEFLWKNIGRDLLRFAVRGFPEYYKERLAKSAFDEIE